MQLIHVISLVCVTSVAQVCAIPTARNVFKPLPVPDSLSAVISVRQIQGLEKAHVDIRNVIGRREERFSHDSDESEEIVDDHLKSFTARTVEAISIAEEPFDHDQSETETLLDTREASDVGSNSDLDLDATRLPTTESSDEAEEDDEIPSNVVKRTIKVAPGQSSVGIDNGLPSLLAMAGIIFGVYGMIMFVSWDEV